MITNEQAKLLADIINPDNVVDFDGDPLVVTDALLVLRMRDPDDLKRSIALTVVTPETDYITVAGLLHFAEAINEGYGEEED